jgi:uncharacterized repeat protein (TIGR01451 family)
MGYIDTRTGGGARSARLGFVIAALAAFILVAGSPGAEAAASADLTVDKTSSASGSLAVGDSYSYTITVANLGAGTAHDVTMEDDLPLGVVPSSSPPPFTGGSCTFASSQTGGSPPHYSVFCQRPSLPASTSVSATFEVRLTRDVACGDITNTASVEASDEPAGDTGNNTASATDTVTCPPSISIHTQVPSFAHVGDEITLGMKVTNSGSIDLHDVRVTDAACSGAISQVADGNGDPTLAPGETWRYRCEHRVTPSAGVHLTSIAVVAAASANGRARASDRASVRVLRPGLVLRVTPKPSSGSPGETITYRYVLHNTGDATVTDISVDDDQLGHVGDVSRLVPGHAVTLTVERLVGARHVWVTDRATATGADPSGRAVTAIGQASVTLVAPSAHGSPSGGAGNGGTAFTGAPIAPPLAAAIILALLGVGALLLERRRRI